MSFSFFIPTYKRSDSLKETISSIFKYWKGDIKITISDNNEDDTAKNVVKEFDVNNIDYSPNKQNIGIDKNMLRFLELCKTKYCWLLGDDDSLSEKSYSDISPLLEEDVDFIILLNGNYVKDYPDGIYAIDNLNNVGNAFLSFWDKLPFGNVIINAERAKCLNYDEVIEKYVGTSHAYSGVLWELAISKFSSKKIGVMSSQSIEVYNVEKSWVNSSVKIYLGEIPEWFKLLPQSLKKYSDKAYTNYLKQIFTLSTLSNFIVFSKQSEVNKDFVNNSISKMPFKYKLKWFFLNVCFPIYQIYTSIKKTLKTIINNILQKK
ncbi:hypothetical protein HYN56_01795 [Flavobacterium crocinum]|uniref:Glycosyltransferase 2-like domain-containing protein n=1 Tax=Flavobacterium crocinum TaxID=2183896 RepID=A0A2S1YG36_9FLAO|nr:glycosyltransferase [Flavobacterium crocinum]AWK03015.1 hypothetical protein HYN56_01795 [Flavobacterium crocinum]